MLKRRLPLVPIFLLLFHPLFAQESTVKRIITESKVEQIVGTLSADEMRGRKAFTPTIDKASDYISGQFERIGLEPLRGLKTYRQHFTIHQLSPASADLKINGMAIDRNNFFYTGNYVKQDWNLSEKKIHVISGTDNFRKAFSETRQSENDLVVIADPAHREIFNRYASYFNRGSQVFNLNEGSSKLYVLTDAQKVGHGRFKLSQAVKKLEASNITGQITGSEHPEEYVLFSAHYDHIGILEPVEGDSIANGADDNASGTTAVILLAEYFKELGPQPRTLIFAGFTAEEAGGFGSQYFSKQMEPEQIIAMFNIEMIGKPSKFGPNTGFMTGFDMTDMGEILQENLQGTPYMIYPDPYPEQNLFFRSDNATLARLGVPAHTFSSDQIDTDPYYHTVNDELETLDIQHLTNMIRAIALSSGSIVTREETPERIDPNNLN